MLEYIVNLILNHYPIFPIAGAIGQLAFWSILVLTGITIVYVIQVLLKKRIRTRRFETLVPLLYVILFGLFALAWHVMELYPMM